MYICSLWGNSIKHNSWATCLLLFCWQYLKRSNLLTIVLFNSKEKTPGMMFTIIKNCVKLYLK